MKPKERPTSPSKARPCSIHPQGWVPIETLVCGWPSPAPSGDGSSIHPQGWVPIETEGAQVGVAERVAAVAFTPKGGCPLKPVWFACTNWRRPKCSIHPQGWVLTGVQGFSAGFQPQARFSQQGGRANDRSPLQSLPCRRGDTDRTPRPRPYRLIRRSCRAITDKSRG